MLLDIFILCIQYGPANFPSNFAILISYFNGIHMHLFLFFIQTPFGHDFTKAVSGYQSFGVSHCFHLQDIQRITPFISLSSHTCPVLCYPTLHLPTFHSPIQLSIHPLHIHLPTHHSTLQTIYVLPSENLQCTFQLRIK